MQASFGVWWFFIIDNVAPFDVVHGFVYSFWLFYKTCLPKLSRVAYLYHNCAVETERLKLVLLLSLEPRSLSPFHHIYCIFPGDPWSISHPDVRKRQLVYNEHNIR
jgi:hypothetical protein